MTQDGPTGDVLPEAVHRGVLWLAFAAAVASVAWHGPAVFRDTRRAVLAVESLTPLERTLLPARSVDLSTEIFVAAGRTMPADATFYVATGNGIEVSNTIALAKTPVFAAYWLLPRRMTTDPARADWVLSYGGDIETLGLAYARVIDLGPGQQLAEVRR